MKVTIDTGSGFCFGVQRAIEQAESILERSGRLYCLGDIVHNKAEMERLVKMGLVSIDHEELLKIRDEALLFRAHGEPLSSYETAEKNRIRLSDATCPIVAHLQNKIRKAWERMSEQNGQLVIFGDPSHPETIGLQARTGGKAIIVTSPRHLSELDPARPVELFSQTTRNLDEYKELEGNIRKMMKKHFEDTGLPLKVHNTICGQISRRKPRIKEFAARYDVVVFVGGRHSSNGKILHGYCREVNPRCWFVSGPEEIVPEWFSDAVSAGVCGATSTPFWLMEEVAERIRKFTAEE